MNTNYTPLLCVKTKLEAVKIIVLSEVGRRKTLFDLHQDRNMTEKLLNGVIKVLWVRERVGTPDADITFFKNKLLEVKQAITAGRNCRDQALLLRIMRKTEKDLDWILEGVKSCVSRIEKSECNSGGTVHRLQAASA